MPDFKCPECSAEMEVEKEWDGLEAECPSCGKHITISLSSEIESTEQDIGCRPSGPVTGQHPDEVKRELDTPSVSETKLCPICGEVIQKTARKCRHCGEWLEPGARPSDKQGVPTLSSPPKTAGWREGDMLFISGTWGAVLGLGGSSYGMIYADSELITCTGPPKSGFWIAATIWILLWPVALILFILGFLQLSKTKDIWNAFKSRDIEAIRRIKRNSFNSKFVWPHQAILNVKYSKTSRKLTMKVKRPDNQRAGDIVLVVDNSDIESAEAFARLFEK
ncbi:MAG: hypothetical protein JW808_11135 [Victivallales bacterium]|nr:hypothetical protein [Victivallales bacterium]